MKQCYTILNSSNQKQVDEGGEYALEKLIEFRRYPLDRILDKLLIDKTTGKRIIWATDGYSEYGENYCDRFEITPGALAGINPVLIQPRAFKALETQQQRTKSKAEVFTPSWIVNKMVNHLDEEWFGRSDVFNIEKDQTWETETEKIDFQGKKWKDYVDRSVLEITCGEAPFIVSRYNATTGEIIPIEERIGILDRKLRIVTENTGNEEDWVKWAKRAYESVYGYEYQGDNLLIGRINLLMTFVDYYQSIWNKEAGKDLLTAITNIITWNFWQMDGLNGTVPLGVPQPVFEQMTLFDIEDKPEEKAPLCKVRKWRAKKTIRYKEIERKEGIDMSQKKFDVVIGNPPYQIMDGGGKGYSAKPVYQHFVAAAKEIQPHYLSLVTPSRWFAGGKGLDQYRSEMLHDKHIEKIYDYVDNEQLFKGVSIVGGVNYFLWNKYYCGKCLFTSIRGNDQYTMLRDLSEYEILIRNNYALELVRRVDSSNCEKMESVVYPRNVFGIASEERGLPKKTSKNPIALFASAKSNSMGVSYIAPDKIQKNNDLIDKYKVIIGKVVPRGGEVGIDPKIGYRVTSTIQMLYPGSVFSDSYLLLGAFENESEAINFAKYMTLKLPRFLLHETYSSMNISKANFRFVPYLDYSKEWTDEELFDRFECTPEERKLVLETIRPMEYVTNKV